MCKNRKRVYGLYLLFVIVMGTSACSLKENTERESIESESIESESTTEEKVQTYQKEEYIDSSVITKEKKELEVYNIQYGTFEKKVPDVIETARSTNYITQPMKVNLTGDNMVIQVTEKLQNYLLVQKGDILATIDLNEKSTDILETELKLQRLQNNYERENKYYQEEYDKKVEEHEKIRKETEEKKKNDFTTEAEKRIYYIEREKEVNIEQCFLEREVLEREKQKRNSEREIQNTQIALQKLQKKAEATTIVAPRDGYVITDEIKIKTDEHINQGDIIGSIINYDQNLLLLGNSENSYTYGMECTMQVNTGDASQEMKATMINGSSNILYGNLDNDYAYFSVNMEKNDKEDMHSYIGAGRMRGTLETIEHVLLVPVNAVTIEDEIPYVTVINEDGSFLKTGFIAGGSSSDYYWVLSGLEEGMQILLPE